ncbi:Esterase [Escovopsis weberi]|uniref:Esterase n=1 Tax=Escovopsis weberi TaxID=150374 RepID=A0A0N0RU07_ESCWE|nr:Esterase [Escovopsis weberi]
MHVVSKPQLSLGEKVRLGLKVLILTPYEFIVNSVQLLSFAALRGLPLRHYFTCAKIKCFFSFSGRQLQFLLPSGSEAYQQWIEKKKKEASGNPAALLRINNDIQRVPGRQANLLWIGNRSAAKKVVFYLHGGGYVIPNFDGYFQACWNCYIEPLLEDEDGKAGASRDEVAVAMLQYDLAEAARFPSQLLDAAAALPVLFEDGFRPRDIIVGGDSAGGNLTILLLHHLLRPHPKVPALTLEEPFAGAYLLSPWLSLDFASPSFRRNARNDMISFGIMESLAKGWIPEPTRKAIASSRDEGAQDAWAINPIGVEESWLCDLAGVTPRLYVRAGKEEILLDNSIELVEKLKKVDSAVDVRFDAEEGEAHDWIAVEGVFNEVGRATKRLRKWARGAFEA